MTSHPTLTPEDAAMAAEYAMGLLDGAAGHAFAARLRAEPALLGEVQAWQEHLVTMTADVSARPPLGAKRRLMVRLFGPSRRAFRFWQGVAIGGSVLAAAFAFALYFQSSPNQPTYFTTEITAEDDSLRLLVVFDGQDLRLTRTSGAALEGRVLELWLIPADGLPRSLGVLPVDSQAMARVSEDLRPLMPGARLAISDEPVGGSPTGQPTGDVLATGLVTAL